MRRHLRRWARNPINRSILRKALDGKTYKVLGNLPPKDKDILVEIVDMRAPKNYYAPWVLHDLVFNELFHHATLTQEGGVMEGISVLDPQTISFLKEDSPKVRKWLTDYEELSKKNKALKQNYPIKIKEDPKAIETIQTTTQLLTLLKRLLPDKYAVKTVPHNLPGVVRIEYPTTSVEAFRILKVEGKEGIPSLMELAQGTKWCTENESSARHYLEENPVIIILAHDKPVVQAHVGLEHGLQIMNVLDNPIDFSSTPDTGLGAFSSESDREDWGGPRNAFLVTVGEVSALLKSMHFFERAFTFYEKKLTSSSPEAVRYALGGMSALGSKEYGGNPKVLPLISKLLYSRMEISNWDDSGMEGIRETAARAIGEVGTPQAASELVKALSTTSIEPGYPLPSGVLGRKDHDFRIAIIKGLKNWAGGSREIPLLRELAFQHIPSPISTNWSSSGVDGPFTPRDQVIEERRQAFRAIGGMVSQTGQARRIHGPTVSSEETAKRLELAIPILASALIDSEDIISFGAYGRSVVQDAAMFLGDTKHIMAVPPLIEALRLEHLDVVRRAAEPHSPVTGRGTPKITILKALQSILNFPVGKWIPGAAGDMILTTLTEILNERPPPNFIYQVGVGRAFTRTISAAVKSSNLARDNTALINAVADFIREYLANLGKLPTPSFFLDDAPGQIQEEELGVLGLTVIIPELIQLLETIAGRMVRPQGVQLALFDVADYPSWSRRLGKDAPGFPSFSHATAQLCMLLKETGQGYIDHQAIAPDGDFSPLWRSAAQKTSACIENLVIHIQNDASEAVRNIEPYVMISDILASIRLYSAAIDELAKLAIPTILETSHGYIQMHNADKLTFLRISTLEAGRMISKMVKILDRIAGPFTRDPINTIYETLAKCRPMLRSRSTTPVQSKGLKSDVYTIMQNHKTFGERGDRIAWLPFVDPKKWPRWVKNKVEGCDICAETLTDCECEPRKNPSRQLELFPPQPYPHPMTGDIVTSILDKCQPELRRIGIELDTILGCGDYGCAFLTSDGRVAKFTKTKKEADAAHFILNHPNPHKSLPRVDQVWILEGCHEYGPLYVILREDLDDLNIVDRDWFAEIMDQFEFSLYHKAIQKSLTEDDIYERLADLFGEIPGRGPDELQVENLADLFVWNMKNGLWLDDIIVSNWGQRADGTIVVRDLGAIKSRLDQIDYSEY